MLWFTWSGRQDPMLEFPGALLEFKAESPIGTQVFRARTVERSDSLARRRMTPKARLSSEHLFRGLKMNRLLLVTAVVATAALAACGKKEDMPAPAPMSTPAPAPTPVAEAASAAVTESVEAAKAIGNAASVAANAVGIAASTAVDAAVGAAKDATASAKKEKKGGC